MMLQNRIEDVRIERALAHPYPGTRATIAKVLQRMLAEGRMSAPKPSDHPAQVLAGYLLLALRHAVLNQTVLAAEARKAAETLRQVFPVAFIARLRTLVDEVPGLTSTAEAVELARRIRRLIEDEADRPPETGPGPAGRAEDESAAGKGSDDAGAEGDDDSNVPSPAKDAVGQPASRAQDRGDDSAPDGTGPDANEEQDGGPAGAESCPDDGTDPGNPLAAVLSAGADDCDADLFAEVGKLLGAKAASTNEVRLPLPEDYAGNALAGMRLLARVQAESARLSARFQGLVQASRMDRPRPVRSGRHLDPRRLHRVAVADARIFARRAQRIAPNTAVHLLVDLSGSMHATVHRRDGSESARAGSALESALALALALDGIAGVTVAATAFPGQVGAPDRVTRMVQHGQSPKACAGAFVQSARGGTPMAQALCTRRRISSPAVRRAGYWWSSPTAGQTMQPKCCGSSDSAGRPGSRRWASGSASACGTCSRPPSR